MPEKIYDEQIVPDEAGAKALKSYMNTHLVYLNEALDTLKAQPHLSLRDLKTIVREKIWKDNPEYVLTDVVYNELYYMYKKFVRRCKRVKLLTDIQYMTFIVQGLNGKGVCYTPGSFRLRLPGRSGTVTLLKPLPQWQEGSMLFLNLSYSGLEDQFRLSVFTSPMAVSSEIGVELVAQAA